MSSNDEMNEDSDHQVDPLLLSGFEALTLESVIKSGFLNKKSGKRKVRLPRLFEDSKLSTASF
jgi:hypothetical protein